MFLLWCVDFMPDSHGDSFASRTMYEISHHNAGNESIYALFRSGPALAQTKFLFRQFRRPFVPHVEPR